MTILIALILGLVQGLTEFLPVSSSGHLMLLNQIFNIDGDFLFVSIVLHLATLLAIVIVFYKDIWQLIRHPFSKQAVNLYVATIPTIVIVLIFKAFIEGFFNDASLLPFCFMFTAFLLLVTHFLSNKKSTDFNRKFKTSSALIMGISQGFAVIPGISRSGTTICTGLILGEERQQTAKFSFLMSIPIILASLIYEIVFTDSASTINAVGVLPLLIAFFSAFLVGIFSIKFMLKIVQESKYYYFSIYLIALSILSLFVI